MTTSNTGATPEPGPTIAFTNSASYGAQIGQNLGSIVNHFPTPPETLPSPSSFVPFARDPHFVDRGALLDQIHETCFSHTNWTALVGLGGVGKSQLAIEYSYRVRDQSPDTWIFWVHASNAARFEQSFQDIADIVKIPDRKSPQADICQLVHSWLRDPKNEKWILILDNLDDAGFLTARRPVNQTNRLGGDVRQSRFFVSYIPHTSCGSVLVTTRTRTVAAALVDKNNILTVDPMNEEQGAALLMNKLGRSAAHEDSQVAALAKTLDFIPLAMVQAAAYISNLRYSIRQYLDQFQKSDRKKEELLSYDQDLGYIRRDLEAQNATTTTWRISFDHIRRTRQSAADLLSLMSFFDPQGIPVALLQHRSGGNSDDGSTADSSEHEDDDNASQSDDNAEVRQDIRILENYSFVTANENVTTLKIHSLVQFAMRKWLQDHGQAEAWKQRFIKNLATAMPWAQFENWAQCQTLFPHVKSAISQKPKQDSSLREWAAMLTKGAHYSLTKGNTADGEELSMKANKVTEKMLGLDHEDTLWTRGMVALAFGLGGKLRESEEIHSTVMETRKKIQGADHPDTLATMYNLATIYQQQGRLDAAEELGEQALEMHKRKLGVEHPHTLVVVINLALTYWTQNRWNAAEELEEQALEICKRKLGVEHPNTLNAMYSLASTWRASGKRTEAVRLMEECVERTSQVLGADHPNAQPRMEELAEWKAQDLNGEESAP